MKNLSTKIIHKILKKSAKLLLGEYKVFKIYTQDLKNFSANNKFPENFCPYQQDYKHVKGFSGPQSHGFIYLDDGGEKKLSRCWYWYDDRYKERNFWPLIKGEAKLVDIETLQEARGMGIASNLIIYSSNEMKKLGFERLYARIWHSNTPSLRAFAKAGWKPHCLVIEIYPLGKKIRFKFST